MTEQQCLILIANHSSLIDSVMTSISNSTHQIRVLYLKIVPVGNNKFEVWCDITGHLQQGSLELSNLLSNYR